MSIVTASSRFYPRDARPYGTIHTGSSEETARRARPTSRTVSHRVVRTDGLLPSLVHTRDRQRSGNLDGLGKRDQRFLAGDLRRNSCAVADLPCSPPWCRAPALLGVRRSGHSRLLVERFELGQAPRHRPRTRSSARTSRDQNMGSQRSSRRTARSAGSRTRTVVSGHRRTEMTTAPPNPFLNTAARSAEETFCVCAAPPGEDKSRSSIRYASGRFHGSSRSACYSCRVAT